MDEKGDVTRLLAAMTAGDRTAFDELFPLVYDELRAIAHRHLRGMSDEQMVGLEEALRALEARNERYEAYLSSGELAQARTRFERAYAISHTTADLGGYVPVPLGYTLWKAGARARATQLFSEYRSFARQQRAKGSRFFAVGYGLAALSAIEGDKAEAYRWLAQVADVGWKDYFFLSRDPLVENLRGDDRFHQILARNKDAVDRMRARVQREGW